MMSTFNSTGTLHHQIKIGSMGFDDLTNYIKWCICTGTQKVNPDMICFFGDGVYLCTGDFPRDSVLESVQHTDVTITTGEVDGRHTVL